MNRIVSSQEYKAILVELLERIDTICNDNGITYFVFYGTLLGAIRHSGFIPWDDDLDICMPRSDYERFCHLILTEYPKIHLLTSYTCKSYPSCFAKVYDDSKIKVELFDNICYDCGAFIDVFPLDKLPNSIDIDKRYAVFEEMNNNIYNYCMPLYAYRRIKFWKKLRLLKNFYKFIIGRTFRQKNLDKREAFMKQFEECETERFVDYSDRNGLLYSSDFAKVLRHKFEDIEVNIPSQYDKVLTRLYGDYKKLPPKENRKTTHSFKTYWNIKNN